MNDWLERAELEMTEPQRTDIMAAIKEFAMANKQLLTSGEFATIAWSQIDGEAA